MTQLRLFVAVAVAGLAVPVLAQSPRPNTWTIDPGHSAARFSVRHMLVSTVRGTLGKVTGTIEYDGKTVESIKADVMVDLSAINTENDSRDKDLKSDNFFDIAKYPTVTFKSKRVQPDGQGKFKLIGDLTMHAVTKELTLEVEGPSPALRQGPMLRIGASATATINRRDWGLQYSKMVEAAPIVGDEVQIQIDVEATQRMVD
jgi:polyisoprenoid-binding protein YceI